MKQSPEILRELGDGLVLRRATTADRDALSEFVVAGFAHPDTGEREEWMGEWIHELMQVDNKGRPRHPTVKPDDFLLVENARGEIVSSCCLISQTWSYDGIPFGVGQPELVLTDPAYRRRGLIREQFKVLHEWSAARGQLAQAITGIPFYYRQFGYEFALPLGAGRSSFVPQNIPALKKGEEEPYRLRPATSADLPFIAHVCAQGARRSLVASQRNAAQWKYELRERDHAHRLYLNLWVIETQAGIKVGAVVERNRQFGGSTSIRVSVRMYELVPGAAWDKVTPSVMRALKAVGEQEAARSGLPLSELGFWLGERHPVYEAMAEALPQIHDFYAWYVRVPNLPAFLERIAPALERRLAESALAGNSGTLRLNFFYDGAELVFAKGRLKRAAAWQPYHMDYGQSGFGNATFPPHTFLQLLMGYRSRDEIHHLFPDCIVDNDRTQMLLDVLFPKKHSHVWVVH